MIRIVWDDKNAEQRAKLRVKPDSEIDFSDIPESDEFDFNYAISSDEYRAMSKSERTSYFYAVIAAKEADRAAKKARKEIERIIEESRQLAHQT